MRLEEGLSQLGMILPSETEAKLNIYLDLMSKWNRTYNLTAIRDPAAMVSQHLLDSLAVLPCLKGVGSLADVGSGAGLPGIPLAVARPDLQVVSIEASQKKAAFQRQAKIDLRLENFQVHCGRVEAQTGDFDGVISRAFAELADFVRLAGHLAPRLFAMKGVYPQEEIERLPVGWRVLESEKLIVPGLGAERHMIVLGRN